MFSFIKKFFKGTLHKACEKGNIEAVKQHLTAGADVNVKDEWGRVPLLITAHGNHKEIAELLIAEGADVNVTDGDGDTPLHRAALMGSKEIAELLIANGADVNLLSKPLDPGGDPRTPLDLAKRYSEIADLLSQHGGKTGEELKAEGK